MARSGNEHILRKHVLDVLEHRATLGYGLARFTFGELRDIIFSRHPGGGRPTKREIKGALRSLGRVRVVDGMIVYRQ